MSLLRTIIYKNGRKQVGNAKSQVLSFKAEKRKFETAARHALREVGQLVTKTMKEGIKNPPKTGRIYRYKGRKHQASAEGQYPANRSGTLRRSVFYRVESWRKLTVGAEAEYAIFLEENLNRPFLHLSLEKTKKQVRNIFKKRLDQEVKGG